MLYIFLIQYSFFVCSTRNTFECSSGPPQVRGDDFLLILIISLKRCHQIVSSLKVLLDVLKKENYYGKLLLIWNQHWGCVLLNWLDSLSFCLSSHFKSSFRLFLCLCLSSLLIALVQLSVQTFIVLSYFGNVWSFEFSLLFHI